MLKVLSLGAGVQSTTVLLMSCRGVLPKLDAAVFADTQWEPKAVYKHLAWLETEAAGYGIPVHRVTRGDLRGEAITALTQSGGLDRDRKTNNFKRWAAMPLYTKDGSGKKGMIQRQCTKEYKIEPIERFIRRELLGLRPRQVAPAKAIEHWFGISADEAYRMRESPNHWQVNYYPLIFGVKSPKQKGLYDSGFDRQDCFNWMCAEGYPEPPRSACVGCPFHSDEEWHKMKTTDPESWADAVAFDREIRAASAALQADGTHKALAGRLVGLPFLHRSCVPLDEVVFKVGKEKAFHCGELGEFTSGMCGV